MTRYRRQTGEERAISQSVIHTASHPHRRRSSGAGRERRRRADLKKEEGQTIREEITRQQSKASEETVKQNNKRTKQKPGARLKKEERSTRQQSKANEQRAETDKPTEQNFQKNKGKTPQHNRNEVGEMATGKGIGSESNASKRNPQAPKQKKRVNKDPSGSRHKQGSKRNRNRNKQTNKQTNKQSKKERKRTRGNAVKHNIAANSWSLGHTRRLTVLCLRQRYTSSSTSLPAHRKTRRGRERATTSERRGEESGRDERETRSGGGRAEKQDAIIMLKIESRQTNKEIEE